MAEKKKVLIATPSYDGKLDVYYIDSLLNTLSLAEKNNVEQKTFEDDRMHIPFGDHTIQKVIKPIPNDYIDILGKQNCDNIYNKFSWFYKAFSYDY